MTHQPTHYEILSLPSSLHYEPLLPAQVLRRAYRRALLQNHPDKALSSGRVYSIDQITDAFNTLGDRKERERYDRELKGRGGGKRNEESGFKTGIETVDLDDLVMDNGVEGDVWFRGCRCGDERGFEVREEELENAAGEGEAEVVVGCRGCSLWLRVLFGVLEDDTADENRVSNGEHNGQAIGG